jgi:hypothetical protein
MKTYSAVNDASLRIMRYQHALARLVHRAAPVYASSAHDESKDDTMIMLLSLGRLLMVAWIVYALILLFAPQYLHRAPDNVGASIQAVSAFVLGHLMDRAIGLLRRRKAMRVAGMASPSESGTI